MEVKAGNMKFRCPNFNIIRNTIILFFIIYLGYVAISMYMGQSSDVFIFNALLIGCGAVCLLEFIILHIWWHSVVFEGINRKVVITQYLLFFPTKKHEIPFENVEISLCNEYISSGRSGGHVWVLSVVDKGREDLALTDTTFVITNSIAKSSLAKKEKAILEYLKRYC